MCESLRHRHELQLQTQFVRELHGLWRSESSAWENEEPPTSVITRMVDHTQHLPVCAQSRSVLLHNDFHDWEQQLRVAWADLLDVHDLVDFHVVQPMPPFPEPGICAHVILVKSANAAWITTLTSVIDPEVRPQPLRIAITTSSQVQLDYLLLVRIF